MKPIKLPANITRSLGRVGLKIKKHGPEALVVTGVIGFVATAVLACRSTIKAKEVLDKREKDLKDINDCKADLDAGVITKEEYSEEDYQKDIKIVNAHTAVELVKLYAPAIGLGILSATSILAGHNITRKRNVALAAAYTAVDTSFKEYRGRVVDRFGKELDKELRYNIKAKEVEEVSTDEETGEEKVVKKTVETASVSGPSDFAKFFDEFSPCWRKDADYNLMFLKKQESFANDKLRKQGHLFLNEVYDMLGIPATRAGQVVGWIYDEKHPIGDNYVSFGIYDLHDESKRAFVNGNERSILLDFNVDGNILDLI